jgi:hypothetical protein
VPTKNTLIQNSYSAFSGTRLISRGPLEAVLTSCKALLDTNGDTGEPLLIFEDDTGSQCDFDFTGTEAEVLARAIPMPAKTGPGRPKLGVVSREVSLLPRHWEWLERDPQGISAALRRLVEEAKKRDAGAIERAALRDAASRFMWAMAGNFPNFEEASRALFARGDEAFQREIQAWPADVRTHLVQLTRAWFSEDAV